MTSLGLCYAPDDSTLSQSWKGLIDCSAGILYYWNTETSVTQYENNLGCVQDSKLICHVLIAQSDLWECPNWHSSSVAPSLIWWTPTDSTQALLLLSPIKPLYVSSICFLSSLLFCYQEKQMIWLSVRTCLISKTRIKWIFLLQCCVCICVFA